MSLKFFKDSRGEYVVSPAEDDEDYPEINVHSDTYPAAYELAVLALHEHGVRRRTHYDQQHKKEYLFPPSIEARVSVEIRSPLKEPRMNLCLPGDFRGLESYRQEVVEGIHDSWIEPGTTKWTYTYHKRLTDWNPSVDLNAPDGGILLPRGRDQIEVIVQDLVRDINSKGAQATTWIPTADPMLEGDRPCLQRIWVRGYEGKDRISLNADWYFRSRDIKAWFENGWALTHLITEKIMPELSLRKNKPVVLRRINDTSDSLHIYGKDQGTFDMYAKRMATDDGFEDRVCRTDRSETDREQTFQEEILEERQALEINPHKSLGSESQEELAERLSKVIKQYPSLVSERDKKFVRDFFPGFL